jgi:twitching motility two-component system response regulator PilG
MLKQITQYLSDEDFIPVPFAQPVKALMQIRRHKPDIILLDIQMGEMSGYDLCKCLRNNSNFKQTPIIMVTGSTGIIDRARAKLVGASGYLTKPLIKQSY